MSIKIRKKRECELFDRPDKCGLSDNLDWIRLDMGLIIEVESIPDEIKDMVDII